tara:strand:+ start:205 stop:444 length:240 start_codon:yes stop_codon:yes gene_type:complete
MEEVEIQVIYRFPEKYVPDSEWDLPGPWPRKGWYREERLNWHKILQDRNARQFIYIPREGKAKKLVRMLKAAVNVAKGV